MKVVYTTPETLLRSKGLERALSKQYRCNLFQRLVFDEAHCVASWGDSFRCDSTCFIVFEIVLVCTGHLLLLMQVVQCE